jgi:hypothetical protein
MQDAGQAGGRPDITGASAPGAPRADSNAAELEGDPHGVIRRATDFRPALK